MKPVAAVLAALIAAISLPAHAGSLPQPTKPTWEEFLASKAALQRRVTSEQNRKCLELPYTYQVRLTRGETEPRVLARDVFCKPRTRLELIPS